jgi:hypothetical protein
LVCTTSCTLKVALWGKTSPDVREDVLDLEET